jgi:cardiolipin synthase A/B
LKELGEVIVWVGPVMLAEFSNISWITVHGLITVLTIMVYILTSHLMHQRRQPAAAIAWMLFILLVPYLALPLFLSFGSRKLKRAVHLPPPGTHRSPGNGSWAISTIAALGLDSPATYRHLNVHQNGLQARKALIETITAASFNIDLCTFLLARDRLGAEIVDLLSKKAKGGVQVRLLLDGLSHIIWLRPDLKRLRASGAICLTFVPPLGSSIKGRSNLRNHRKLAIADAGTSKARMWCGGRNLCDEYFEGKTNHAAWPDLSFDLQGALTEQASSLFEKDWYFAKNLKMMRDSSRAVQSAEMPLRTDALASLIPSGPDHVDDTLHALLVTASYQAQDKIALITPYFVPDTALLMALCLAARRGVEVDLLMPRSSNHKLSDFARSRAIRALSQAGGRIWLSGQMLHAKLTVIDDALALSGSANLDNRSLFLNYELMVAFHGPSDVKLFMKWFEMERSKAKVFVPSEPSFLRDLAEGMTLWLGFQL